VPVELAQGRVEVQAVQAEVERGGIVKRERVDLVRMEVGVGQGEGLGFRVGVGVGQGYGWGQG